MSISSIVSGNYGKINRHAPATNTAEHLSTVIAPETHGKTFFDAYFCQVCSLGILLSCVCVRVCVVIVRHFRCGAPESLSICCQSQSIAFLKPASNSTMLPDCESSFDDCTLKIFCFTEKKKWCVLLIQFYYTK